MKLISVDNMKMIEKKADKCGLSYSQMMQNAGSGVGNFVLEYMNSFERSFCVIGLVGPGNNGGDCLIALEYLELKGIQTIAFIYGRDLKTDSMCLRLSRAGTTIWEATNQGISEAFNQPPAARFIVIDGLLGTGFHPPIEEDLRIFIKSIKAKMQEYFAQVIAIDCPSGVNCINGDADIHCISADITLCMGAIKTGLLKLPAFNFAGEIKTIDIGLSQVISDWEDDLIDVVDAQMVIRMLPERHKGSHKGVFGKTLMIGGCINYCGAVALGLKAAYRSGVGLATGGVTEPVFTAIAGSLPEATWLILPGDQGNITSDAKRILKNEMPLYSSIALGPGLGNNKVTLDFVKSFINLFSQDNNQDQMKMGYKTEKSLEVKEFLKQPPIVIDADGLKCLAKIPDWWLQLSEKVVLTPHPGEMALLTGISVDVIQNDRALIAARYSKIWRKTVVLKGAFTVIADPSGHISILPYASSSLAHAGTGDVLTGIIASYLAQGVICIDAAILAVYIHAQAAKYAEVYRHTAAAVMAGDIIDHIGQAIHDLEK